MGHQVNNDDDGEVLWYSNSRRNIARAEMAHLSLVAVASTLVLPWPAALRGGGKNGKAGTDVGIDRPCQSLLSLENSGGPPVDIHIAKSTSKATL